MLFGVRRFRGQSCLEHSTSEHSTSLSEGHFLCRASCDLCLVSMGTVLVDEVMAEETMGEKIFFLYQKI
jgi:hypothetical protein